MLNKIHQYCKIINLEFIFLGLLFFSTPALSEYRQPPPRFNPDRISLFLDNHYYLSKKNYDQNGNSINLVGDNSYQFYRAEFGGSYIFTPEWLFATSLQYTNAQSESSKVKRTNGEVTGATLLLQYDWANGRLRMVPEAGAQITTTEISETQDTVLTNEGVHSFFTGSWVFLNWGALKNYGYLGIIGRDQERSQLAQWILGASLRWSHTLLSAELNGYKSVIDDVDTEQNIRRSILNNNVNGGSLSYYSVNPDIINAKFQAHQIFTKTFSGYLAYEQALAGANVSQGQSVYLGLIYHYQTGSESDSRTRLNNKAPVNNKNVNSKSSSDFSPNIEQDYDESIFEKESE